MADPRNKSWNWAVADSNRATVVLDKLETLIPLWQADPRYSAYVPQLRQVVTDGRQIAQLIQDYLAVQGT